MNETEKNDLVNLSEILIKLGSQYDLQRKNPARAEIGSLFNPLGGTGVYVILLTPAQINDLPNGVDLTNFFDGSVKRTGRDYIDLDTRGGFTCWGIPEADFA